MRFNRGAKQLQYFDEVNADPVVYHWIYKLDEISEDEAKGDVAS